MAGTILPVFEDERCSWAKGDNSVWASLKVIHSTIWGFTDVHKVKKVKRSCSSFQLSAFITVYMGGAYILVYQKWSKIGTHNQKDAKEAEMRKRFKIFDRAPSYWT